MITSDGKLRKNEITMVMSIIGETPIELLYFLKGFLTTKHGRAWHRSGHTEQGRQNVSNERKYIKNTITNPPFDIRGVVYREIEPLGKNRPVQNFGNTWKMAVLAMTFSLGKQHFTILLSANLLPMLIKTSWESHL